MRGSIRCLLLGAVALTMLRHLGGWHLPAPPPRPDDLSWWGSLSFALAAVVDPDRAAR